MDSRQSRAALLARSGELGASTLFELLRLPEGGSLELKRSERLPLDRVAHHVAELARAEDGGYLIIGVAGLDDPEFVRLTDEQAQPPSLHERVAGLAAPERTRSTIETAARMVGTKATVEIHELFNKTVALALIAHATNLNELLHRPRRTQRPERERDRDRRAVLVLATEWWSRHGGLSTFNRGFCEALARADCDVTCLVPHADPDERQTAASLGVSLETPSYVPGLGGPQSLLRAPEGISQPDLIIGHGRITGPQAAALAADRFPGADRVHIVHTVAEQIEWFKDRAVGPVSTRAGDRDAEERELAHDAAVVGAVGPLLTRKSRNLVRGLNGAGQVVSLLPGIDGPPNEPLSAPDDLEILVLGRTEDSRLKGLDIAARAVGALQHAPLDLGTRPSLVVRGSPAAESHELQASLSRLAGEQVQVLVRDWTVAPERLSADLGRATLVLMPSRHEGFGLVGLEAIAAGVPVLVSDTSGLAEVLNDLGWHQNIVSTRGPVNDIVAAWTRAIDRVLFDRNAAFRRAHDLRAVYAEENTWDQTIRDLLFAVDNVSR